MNAVGMRRYLPFIIVENIRGKDVDTVVSRTREKGAVTDRATRSGGTGHAGSIHATQAAASQECRPDTG
jgi:hypothetical protein